MCASETGHICLLFSTGRVERVYTHGSFCLRNLTPLSCLRFISNTISSAGPRTPFTLVSHCQSSLPSLFLWLSHTNHQTNVFPWLPRWRLLARWLQSDIFTDTKNMSSLKSQCLRIASGACQIFSCKSRRAAWRILHKTDIIIAARSKCLLCSFYCFEFQDGDLLRNIPGWFGTVDGLSSSTKIKKDFNASLRAKHRWM